MKENVTIRRGLWVLEEHREAIGPPVVSSIINDHDEFFDRPSQGGG
jgi:hypothetical protein